MGLILYYTGAQTFGAEQVTPVNSVGGYVSCSQVPNGELNTIFDSVPINVNTLLSEYTCLALKNDSDTDITDITVFTVPPTSDNRVKLTLAATDPLSAVVKNGVAQYYFQKVDNRRVRPSFIQSFFNVNSRFASAILELSAPESIGGVITVLGVDTLAAEKNLTIDETYQLIVDAFENNATYTATFVNKTIKTINTTVNTTEYGDEVETVVKHVLIERNDIGQNTDPVTFSSTSTATLKNSVTFGGGTDNSVSVGELKAGEYIGLWFKRDNIAADYTNTANLFPSQLEKTETIKLFFDYV